MVKCPYCGHSVLARTRPRAYAVKLVLSRALKPTPVKTLASAYMIYASCEYLAACRAIQRLATEGFLKRVRKGVYRTR